jgi:hypothetical protein
LLLLFLFLLLFLLLLLFLSGASLHLRKGGEGQDESRPREPSGRKV